MEASERIKGVPFDPSKRDISCFIHSHDSTVEKTPLMNNHYSVCTNESADTSATLHIPLGGSKVLFHSETILLKYNANSRNI